MTTSISNTDLLKFLEATGHSARVVAVESEGLTDVIANTPDDPI
jgi:hypothetical protein